MEYYSTQRLLNILLCENYNPDHIVWVVNMENEIGTWLNTFEDQYYGGQSKMVEVKQRIYNEEHIQQIRDRLEELRESAVRGEHPGDVKDPSGS